MGMSRAVIHRERLLASARAAEGAGPRVVARLRDLVYTYYLLHGRDLPWRVTRDPYAVFVSEVMLQQTPVNRVIPRYTAFLDHFPDWEALAGAGTAAVLRAWQGLGYNRRALALRNSAHEVLSNWNGILPSDPAALHSLPGIGPHTAASIAAFAFNVPTVFVETNIRAVLIHWFFSDGTDIHDRDLLPLAAAVLDRRHPRKWYNAMMDYGAALKARIPNPSRRSAHHRPQSRFEGSDRQIRGEILRQATAHTAVSLSDLVDAVGDTPERIGKLVDALVREGFLTRRGRCIRTA